jgi:hypothetical protein
MGDTERIYWLVVNSLIGERILGELANLQKVSLQKSQLAKTSIQISNDQNALVVFLACLLLFS